MFTSSRSWAYIFWLFLSVFPFHSHSPICSTQFSWEFGFFMFCLFSLHKIQFYYVQCTYDNKDDCILSTTTKLFIIYLHTCSILLNSNLLCLIAKNSFTHISASVIPKIRKSMYNNFKYLTSINTTYQPFYLYRLTVNYNLSLFAAFYTNVYVGNMCSFS